MSSQLEDEIAAQAVDVIHHYVQLALSNVESSHLDIDVEVCG